jgi:hypothetical protein
MCGVVFGALRSFTQLDTVAADLDRTTILIRRCGHDKYGRHRADADVEIIAAETLQRAGYRLRATANGAIKLSACT